MVALVRRRMLMSGCEARAGITAWGYGDFRRRDLVIVQRPRYPLTLIRTLDRGQFAQLPELRGSVL